jgi:hypothetical protein
MENLIPLFVALTGAAVVLQAGLLAAMYLAMRKTSTRMETLADEVKTKALPTLETTQSMLAEIRPKVEVIADNLMATSTVLRDEAQRIDAAVNDLVDRARLQVIRADDMLTRTLDRVEETSEIVQKTVTSPVRHVSGVIKGVTAGLEFLIGNRGKNGGSREARRPVPQDEMFI